MDEAQHHAPVARARAGHAGPRPRAAGPGRPRRRPRSSSTRRSGSAVTPRPCWPATRTCGWSGSTATPTRCARSARPAGRAQRPHHAGPRRLRLAARRCCRPPGSSGSTACCSTWASPRCSSTPTSAGFSYSRDTGARHADGPDVRADRGRRGQHLLGRGAQPGAAGVRRGALRPADRAGDRPGARGRPAHVLGAARRAGPRRGAGGDPPYRWSSRPSAPSRRCGSRSTTSSARSSARCPPRSPRCGSAVGSSCWPTSRSRTGSSSATFAAGATSTAPPDLPVVPDSAQPQLRLLTRGAEQASPSRDRGQPARRIGAAARRRTRSGRPHERHRTPSAPAALRIPAGRRGPSTARPPSASRRRRRVRAGLGRRSATHHRGPAAVPDPGRRACWSPG